MKIVVHSISKMTDSSNRPKNGLLDIHFSFRPKGQYPAAEDGQADEINNGNRERRQKMQDYKSSIESNIALPEQS